MVISVLCNPKCVFKGVKIKQVGFRDGNTAAPKPTPNSGSSLFAQIFLSD